MSSRDLGSTYMEVLIYIFISTLIFSALIMLTDTTSILKKFTKKNQDKFELILFHRAVDQQIKAIKIPYWTRPPVYKELNKGFLLVWTVQGESKFLEIDNTGEDEWSVSNGYRTLKYPLKIDSHFSPILNGWGALTGISHTSKEIGSYQFYLKDQSLIHPRVMKGDLQQ
jgi:hypothetical protein